MKKFVSVVLAVCLILSVGIVGVYAFGKDKDGFVQEPLKTVDGCIELVSRFAQGCLQKRNNYSECSEIASIPEIQEGYIPQGFCYSELLKCYIISFYHQNRPSLLSFVDESSGKKKYSIELMKEDRTGFYGHVGGLACDGTNLYIAHENGFYVVTIYELAAARLVGHLVPLMYVKTDVKCSYLNCDGENLYAGEFYAFDINGKYDTVSVHQRMISMFEMSYAHCNVYSLSEIKNYINKDKIIVPICIYSVPNCVQGITKNDAGELVLSISYGRKNDSFLYVYNDVSKKDEADFIGDFNGSAVNGYFLDKANRISEKRLPPVLEGIDNVNGKITGIFESCAEKYSDAAVVVDSICEFE